MKCFNKAPFCCSQSSFSISIRQSPSSFSLELKFWIIEQGKVLLKISIAIDSPLTSTFDANVTHQGAYYWNAAFVE